MLLDCFVCESFQPGSQEIHEKTWARYNRKFLDFSEGLSYFLSFCKTKLVNLTTSD